MAHIAITIALCFCVFSVWATNFQWTWLSGESAVGGHGVYGPKGDASAQYRPGTRRFATGWYDDTRGELWLFGGYGYDSGSVSADMLNDLWRYRINDSTWIWISGNDTTKRPGVYGSKGNASPDNYPGARSGAVGCYDSLRQEFWLFGGKGYATGGVSSGYLNDLWRYRVNDSTWTWISGSNAIDQIGMYGTKGNASTDYYPGGRENSIGWFDSVRQELWVFGGGGITITFPAGPLNDLWRYRVNDSTWTWVSGSDIRNHPGFYGQKGNASTENYPRGRHSAVGGYDSLRDEFWLFGGYTQNSDLTIEGMLNDLWIYRMNDSTWTWISGSDIIDQPAVYGEKGNASTDYYPGARYAAVGWFDSLREEFWVFSGDGLDYSRQGYLNDLWRYRVNDSTWTWISGSDTRNQKGFYGEKGNASTENYPGSRYAAVGWFDNVKEEIWLFGGLGYDENTDGFLNDVWKAFEIKHEPQIQPEPTTEPEIEPEIEPETELELEPETELCPPLYQLINHTCIPLLHCSSSDNDNNNNNSPTNCVLKCDQMEMKNSTATCVIDGDMVVNASVPTNDGILDTNAITIVGVVNITGSVVVASDVTVILSVGSTLHVGKCLLLEEGSEIVIIVDESSSFQSNHIVATYDGGCSSSSSELLQRVKVEQTSSYDECREGLPIVQVSEDQSGRSHLKLLFAMDIESDECNDDSSDINIVVIAVSVSIAALVVVVIVSVVAVPKLRKKILPTRHFLTVVKSREP